MGERLTARAVFEAEGCRTEEERTEYLEEVFSDCSCPALCSSGCDVEPDGRCAHGHPSLLLALGLV